MRKLILIATAGLLAVPPALTAQQAGDPEQLKEFPIEWGGRTRDPYVAPDGKVWFVGQAGNYIAYLDPSNGATKRYEIEAGTNPHNLIVDEQGQVWYAGNRNGRIGRLDPATGEARIYRMPDASVRDPHTLVFDGRGHIWFTAQGSNRVGRLHMETGKIDLVTPHDGPSNPYGIVIDDRGRPWVALFRTNTVAMIDPVTLEVTRYEGKTAATRSRRIEWTPDGMVWYVDEPRGFLGRINPATGEVKEWQAPGGQGSRPYALTKDDQGRLWFSETGPTKQLVGFDPATERFFSVNPVSHNIRHMMFDARTGQMWFGTDANHVGRIVVRPPVTE